MLLFFFFGLFATIGSDALNSFFERDTDQLMRRTKNRTIPKGLVNPFYALIVGFLMIIISSFAFLILFNGLSSGLVLFGAMYYILFYTLYLKRRTPLNTIIGGLAGSIPALTGWVAARGNIGLEAALLALIVFLWSPGHFWCLAMKYKEDYARAKLPMLPVVVDTPRALIAVGGFNLSTAMVILISILVISKLVYAILASLALIMLILATLNLALNPNEKGAWRAFKISSPALALVFTGLFLSSL
jgi:protoheme IX farnesyltransferase